MRARSPGSDALLQDPCSSTDDEGACATAAGAGADDGGDAACDEPDEEEETGRGCWLDVAVCYIISAKFVCDHEPDAAHRVRDPRSFPPGLRAH
eukprot:1223014-Rhodomonas_salina.1